MAGIGQYLKETRGELRHVAWPTQAQTVVYTVLVALISIGIALYLGFFDFLFTTGLTRVVSSLPANSAATEQPASSSSPITVTPVFSATSTK
jgi:preprotein translocase SecE subunit